MDDKVAVPVGDIVKRAMAATTPMPMITHASGLAHSEQVGELAMALSDAQAQIVGAIKDSANSFFKSNYADLASVWDSCRKPLTSNGLAVSQWPVQMGNGIGVITVLMHRSGQWMAAPSFAIPKDMGAQAIGSVITYLRRYALAACVGVPQIDDDGEAAEARHKTAKPTQTQEPPDMGPDEPGSHDGDEPGAVRVVQFKRAQSKPHVHDDKCAKPCTFRPWAAGFVTLSDGQEGGSFDAATVNILEQAFTSKRLIRYVGEPSKRDTSKVNITAADFADAVVF